MPEWSDWYEVARQDATYQGKVHVIPYRMNARGNIIYRKSLFEKAGLDPTKPPTNWEEALNMALKLTQKDGSGKITLQAVEYPGLSMSLRNRQVVGLESTQASWPVPHDLRVGTAASRVRQVLGAPTMEGPGPDGVQGLSYCEKENCVQFLVHVPTGTIRRVRWSFYYD